MQRIDPLNSLTRRPVGFRWTVSWPYKGLSASCASVVSSRKRPYVIIFENIPESEINFDETRQAFLQACVEIFQDPAFSLQEKIDHIETTNNALRQIMVLQGVLPDAG